MNIDSISADSPLEFLILSCYFNFEMRYLVLRLTFIPFDWIAALLTLIYGYDECRVSLEIGSLMSNIA